MSGTASAADECGTGAVIFCEARGNPYATGITYTAPALALTVRSGTVVDTTSVIPVPNSVQTTLGIGVRPYIGSATAAGRLAVTVEAGASIIAPHAVQSGVLVRDWNAGSDAQVEHAGLIRVGGAGSYGIDVRAGGTVQIDSTGRIEVSGAAGGIQAVDPDPLGGMLSIQHSGVIQGDASSSGIGILAQKQVAGEVKIVQRGVVSGVGTGISAIAFGSTDVNYTFDNQRQISATNGGIYASGGGTAVLDNTGIIEAVSASAGIAATFAMQVVEVHNTGQLIGGRNGLYLSATQSTINNSGGILATTGAGVLNTSGTLFLDNRGLIEGTLAVDATGDGVRLYNAGTLTGSTGTAVRINGNDALLTLDTGSALGGDALSNGVNNRVLLQGVGQEDAALLGWTSLRMAGVDWRLAGDAAFTDPLAVDQGRLWLLGATLQAPSFDVASGAGLGGNGYLQGAVQVADGGRLSGTAGAALRMASLQLAGTAITEVGLGAPSTAALFQIDGDVRLDGVLQVTDEGGFGPGLYRMIDYGGVLDDQGWEIAPLPIGSPPTQLSLQTSVAGQVNLINAAGVALGFWDGPGAPANTVVDGGDGVWDLGQPHWTGADGAANDRWHGGFAVFQGRAGTVRVDNSLGAVAATGLQFVTDGYRLVGDALLLDGAVNIIRVGDGSVRGAGMQAELDVVLAGSGALVKTDHGRLVLGADSSGFGQDATVRDGALQVNGRLGSHVRVETGARLEGTGTVGRVTLGPGALLAPGTSEGTLGTFTVGGDFIADGGELAMDVVLAGDDAASDRLHIRGDSEGHARLRVNQVGGNGAQTVDGIRLVQIDGQSNAQFELAGRVVGGAHEYFLFNGSPRQPDDGDWYLRSQVLRPGDPCLADPTLPECEAPPPVLRAEAGAYLANQAAATGMFGIALHDRNGGTARGLSERGAWVRVSRSQADYGVIGDQLTVNGDTSVMQIGTDLLRWGADARGQFGVMLGGGRANNTVTSRETGYSAKGKVEGDAVGVYASWLQDPAQTTGVYLDAWAQYAQFRSTVQGDALAKERYDSDARTASVEAGYSFRLLDSTRTAMFLEPQLQLSYTDFSADRHVETNGTVIDGSDSSGLTSRVGVRLFGHANSDVGNRVQPFVAVNWVHGADDSSLRFDGERLAGGVPRDRYEATAGASLQLGQRWTAWGDMAVQKGRAGYRDVAGQLGLRASW
ncbi:MAG: autotransporter outer membrane beta-barrel domain-containing protein [Stenotrophomonas maltophilia]